MFSSPLYWRFLSQGASEPRGYHIMWMMALLSWVPSEKTRQRRGGLDGGKQESKICYTAQRALVWWSWAEWAVVLVENKCEPFISSPPVSVGISHKLFAGIQGMANDGLWCRFHLTVPTSMSPWSRQTKRQTCLFIRFWDEWCFPSS